MRRRLTYEEVKNYIEVESGSEYKLISENYINAKTKLELMCNKGHAYSVTISHFKSGRRCPKCRNERLREARQTPESDILTYIKQQRYSFIDWVDSYKNRSSRMIIRCPDGHEYESSVNNFKAGYRCQLCSGNIRHDGLFIYEQFEKHGFIPLFHPDEYINNKQRLPYRCKEHSDVVQYVRFSGLRWNVYSCKYCYYDAISKENNYRWSGVTEVSNFLRVHIGEWMKESMVSCGYKCVLTGSKFEVVHHTLGFNTIVDKVFKNTSIPIKSIIGEYTDKELDILVLECKRIHKEDSPLGVSLLMRRTTYPIPSGIWIW